MGGSKVELPEHTCKAVEKSNSSVSYVNKFGDITFIVSNSFTESKTLTDIYEDIIISAYRQISNDPT